MPFFENGCLLQRTHVKDIFKEEKTIHNILKIYMYANHAHNLQS